MIKVYRNSKTGLYASFLLLAVFIYGVLAGCSEQQSTWQSAGQTTSGQTITGQTMGTTYHITIVDRGQVDTSELKVAIDQLLQAINQSMSTYIESSELNQFNRAVENENFPLSPQLCEVLSVAADVFTLTNGAFDPTVSPLVNLWGFGPERSIDEVPETTDITEAMASIGFQHVDFDCSALTASKLLAVHIDLSAIAKGYAVDEISRLLGARGLEHFLVEVGGEVYVAGLKQGGKPWVIAIERPAAAFPLQQQKVHKLLKLTDTAMATSGDYRNYFEKDGVRYSHTLDPETGYPVTHNLASVTILDKSVARADALATAMMVLGAERGLVLAEEMDIAAHFVVKDSDGFADYSSSAFRRMTERQPERLPAE